MARKHKAAASTSAPPPPSPQRPQGDAHIYVDEVARTESVAIKAKAIVRERGIDSVMPQLEHIQAMGWQEFAKPDDSKAVKSVVQEFYANLCSVRSNTVPIRGQDVDISLAAINRYYKLPPVTGDGLSHLLEHNPPLAEISQVLTRRDINLLPDCHGIQRGRLTLEAKCWTYFVGARLRPVVSHSDIHRPRALCIYAIMIGTLIDVGRLINMEIRAFYDRMSNRVLGFPVLITQLCAQAGVDVTPADSGDKLLLLPLITEKLFLAGEKAKVTQRQRAAEEEAEYEQEEEEAPHMDNDQGHHEDDRQEQDEEEQPVPHQPQEGPVHLSPQLAALSHQLGTFQETVLSTIAALGERVTAIEEHLRPPQP